MLYYFGQVNKAIKSFLNYYMHGMEFALCENYREECFNFKFDNITMELCHGHYAQI